MAARTRTTEKPNVVWLTLDSVRQDHTTMDGHERETTPRIQELADRSDGVAFSSRFAHARASAMSVPSLSRRQGFSSAATPFIPTRRDCSTEYRRGSQNGG